MPEVYLQFDTIGVLNHGAHHRVLDLPVVQVHADFVADKKFFQLVSFCFLGRPPRKFFGRPPSKPLAREAACLASVLARPPLTPTQCIQTRAEVV